MFVTYINDWLFFKFFLTLIAAGAYLMIVSYLHRAFLTYYYDGKNLGQIIALTVLAIFWPLTLVLGFIVGIFMFVTHRKVPKRATFAQKRHTRRDYN